MSKLVKITQAFDKSNPAGDEPTVQTQPASGIAYTKENNQESEIAPAGTATFTLPALFTAFAVTVRIYAEEDGKDLSDDYSIVLATDGPQTINLNPTPNEDGSIQLTIPARFGVAGTEHLTSVTVTDLDGLHADTAKVSFRAVA